MDKIILDLFPELKDVENLEIRLLALQNALEEWYYYNQNTVTSTTSASAPLEIK